MQDGIKKEWEGGYEPSHPWFYKFNKPLPPEEIEPATIAKDCIPQDDLKNAEAELETEIRGYRILVEKGAEALSEYDRKFGSKLALETALSLKHNHIAYFKGILEHIPKQHQPDLFQPDLF